MEIDIPIGIDLGNTNSCVGIEMNGQFKLVPIFEAKYGKNPNFDENSSMLLTRAKKTVEGFFGKQINKAVIAVPIHFDDSQRQLIKNAANNAGLKLLKLITYPTAAAIAYGLDKMGEPEQNILIFDLESNNLDVSLLTVEDGIFEVKSAIQDHNLGGDYQFFINEFQREYGIDIENNPRTIEILRIETERAKRIFSTSIQTMVEVNYLADNYDFSMSLTRVKFEELCLEYFKECILPVEQVLTNSNFSKNQIHNVILVGGSTKIPKVIEILTEYFNGKEPLKNINPEEVIAYGAVIHGFSIMKDKEYDDTKVFNKKEVTLAIDNPIILRKKEERLNKEDIEKMIKEAGLNKPRDDNFIKKIESKNKLECYIYSVRNILSDENIKSKLGQEEMINLHIQIGKTIEWIEFNPNIQTEEYESMQKKMEAIFNHVLPNINHLIKKEELNPKCQPYVEEVD